MLAHRLATGLTLVALFLAVLFGDEFLFAPWYPLWSLVTTVALAWVALELVDLLGHSVIRPNRDVVLGGVLAIAVTNWLPHLVDHWFADERVSRDAMYLPAAAIHALSWPLLAFVGVVLVSFLAQSLRFKDAAPGTTIATVAGTVLATAYVGVLGSFVIQLRWLDGPYHGLVPIGALIAAAKGCDIGAYTFGRIAGRHKMSPVLSPNKTIEGAIGGLILGTVAALLVLALGRFFDIPVLAWPEAVGFGVLVSLAAMLGDLMESMIKRDCARKDASDSLPGFGGVLDVVDSLLFAGPTALGYWLAFGP